MWNRSEWIDLHGEGQGRGTALDLLTQEQNKKRERERLGCQHDWDEDHLICANCGNCREDLDSHDLCTECGGKDES